jgi:hypothetical protein
VRAKQWSRHQIQAYGSPCTSGNRRPRGVLDGIPQVDTCPDPPNLGQRNRSHGARGGPSRLLDGLRATGEKATGEQRVNVCQFSEEIP